MGGLLWYVWSRVMIRPPQWVAPYYETTVLCMMSSILVEVAAEVPFVLGELQMWTKTRVRERHLPCKNFDYSKDYLLCSINLLPLIIAVDNLEPYSKLV